jgi:hypothetical protein
VLAYRVRPCAVDVEDAANLQLRMRPLRAHVYVEYVSTPDEGDLHAGLFLAGSFLVFASFTIVSRIISAVKAVAMLWLSGMTALSLVPCPMQAPTSSAY